MRAATGSSSSDCGRVNPPKRQDDAGGARGMSALRAWGRFLCRSCTTSGRHGRVGEAPPILGSHGQAPARSDSVERPRICARDCGRAGTEHAGWAPRRIPRNRPGLHHELNRRANAGWVPARNRCDAIFRPGMMVGERLRPNYLQSLHPMPLILSVPPGTILVCRRTRSRWRAERCSAGSDRCAPPRIPALRKNSGSPQ
jgi:hypothetical protein